MAAGEPCRVRVHAGPLASLAVVGSFVSWVTLSWVRTCETGGDWPFSPGASDTGPPAIDLLGAQQEDDFPGTSGRPSGGPPLSR